MSKLSVFEKNLVDFACLTDKRVVPGLHALVVCFAAPIVPFVQKLDVAPVRREAGAC